jgi:hypothetical protein
MNQHSDLGKVINQLGIRNHFCGDYWQCTCPVHPSDNYNSMTVWKNGIWKCWTSDCNEKHGNRFEDLVKALGVNPEDLLKGIQFDREYNEEEVDIELPVINITREQIRSRLKIPSEYYLYRGFSAETLDKFDVGDCHSKEMKDRAVFPIYNQDYNLVGCAGRSLLNKSYVPKWKFSKNFRSGATFFSINHAYESILRTGTAVLVEGMSDAMRLQEYGIQNAIGCLGAKLSRGQVKLLNSMGVTNIVIALDPDPTTVVNGVVKEGTGPMRTRQIIERYKDEFNFVPIELKSDPDELPRNEAERIFGNYV